MPLASGPTAISKMYVGGTLVSAAYANSASLLFNPSSLFSASEQGAWYDPSDWTTLFQDAAGTTPVTAVGQPVGLMLDKRLGLVRGAELAVNGGFNSDVSWFGSVTPGATITWDSGTALLNSTTAGVKTATSSPLLNVGSWYEVKFTVTATNAAGGNAFLGIAGTYFRGGSAIGVEQRIIVQATLTYILLRVDGIAFANFDNISVRELPGNHATQPTAINRPVLQIDGNGKHYLAFNGTNSSMVTPSIDFTATDKMTIVAGVRKLSDTAAMLAELSANTNTNLGTLYVLSGNDSGFAYSSKARGTVLGGVTGVASSASPDSCVLSVTHDIAGPLSTTRRNAIAGTNSSATLGTGNFGNFPIYIGARAGASLFFNGQLYSMIVRGALSDATQIGATETFVNSKTGAY